ncbi:MAG TPA: ATP-binding protein [Salinivirgaceae bacterium]|nr:ATP-binding protein [Salinivirgaceae bacterium]
MNPSLNPLEQEVFDAYMTYFSAYARRDWNTVKSMFHPEITVIGTGIDEIKLTPKDIADTYNREFEQAPILSNFNITSYHVQLLSDDTALIILTCDMDFSTPEQIYHVPDNRTTALMKKVDNSWKIYHAHWSQPAPGQDEGESIPYKKLQEENRHLEQLIKARTRQLAYQTEQLQNLNQTKDTILSIISHDLRAPFNSILGLSNLMLMTFEKNYANKEYFHQRLTIVHQQLQTLYDLVDNILNWAKSQSNDLHLDVQLCSLSSILNSQISILSNYIEEKQLSIIENYDKNLLIKTNCDLLGIVIRNILGNAIKFSHANGEIIIESTIHNHNLSISIIDHGIGIPASSLKALNNEASILTSTPGTNNEKGSGIGIRLCQQLIKKMNGSLTIKSNKKTGTKVSINLPASVILQELAD